MERLFLNDEERRIFESWPMYKRVAYCLIPALPFVAVLVPQIFFPLG